MDLNNNNLFLAEIPNRIFLSLGMHQFYQYGFNFFFDYEERLVNHNQKKILLESIILPIIMTLNFTFTQSSGESHSKESALLSRSQGV